MSKLPRIQSLHVLLRYAYAPSYVRCGLDHISSKRQNAASSKTPRQYVHYAKKKTTQWTTNIAACTQASDMLTCRFQTLQTFTRTVATPSINLTDIKNNTAHFFFLLNLPRIHLILMTSKIPIKYSQAF